jgi:AraC-like DNA-binding protein
MGWAMKLTHLAISFSRLGKSLPHRHNDWEIILNLDGTGVDVTDQQQHPFEPGSIVVYPPGIRHGKKSDSGGFQDIFATLHDPMGFTGQQPSHFADDSTHTIRHLMMTAHLYHQLDTREGRSIALSLMEAVCGILLVWNRSDGNETGVMALQHALLQHVSDASFRIEEALGAIHYAKDYTRKQFRQTFGVSPLEYLTQLRIAQARRLLENPAHRHLSITEIAHLCGFMDSGYFGRIFRRESGLAPAAYRSHHMVEMGK